MDTIRELTPAYRVTGQVHPNEVADLAASGIRTIVNLRPDDEGGDQPPSAALENEARAHGIAYHYLPVVPGQIETGQVEQFRAIVDAAEAPVLGFCRSGMRACSLWALTRAGDVDADTLIEQGAAIGYDISPLRARLAGQ